MLSMIVLFLRASFLETIADFFDQSARFWILVKFLSAFVRPSVSRRRAGSDVSVDLLFGTEETSGCSLGAAISVLCLHLL